MIMNEWHLLGPYIKRNHNSLSRWHLYLHLDLKKAPQSYLQSFASLEHVQAISLFQKVHVWQITDWISKASHLLWQSYNEPSKDS